ncbi:flagellar biosynthesis protein FlhF [Rhodoferax ferrireducens]|uniref:flagellar biosynthesis protein FlhF n=1 Tax=Rhodoferax ferrireducens TaxID=192843 RepID=UPI00298EC3D0|nr:flagellar biosynthesis protein FlhF [Rhodoferax ferrireducens]WPC66488.1 flagellar biosynthesis protein FlhF [Rhodoferax ferrireducens]
MNIQRFNAPTAREALAKARHAFGDGTLILSNRPTATGVEVVATGEETLSALDSTESFANRSKDQPALRRATLPSVPEASTPVEEDVTQLAMSTLSFQDYVRERMLRRRHESMTGPTAAVAQEAAPERTPKAAALPGPRQIEIQAPIKVTAVPKPAPVPAAPHAPALSQGIVNELHAMKALIEDRFNTLTWLGQARQSPIQSNLMLKLIRAGYSPTLARTILERMPEEMGATDSVRWVMDILERNLKTDAATRPIHEEGGTFALVGATGVGKTTTAAKLAGLCARTHGPASVGLITLDTYRVGAHEQLRAFGRMLGVVAHLAHDRAALQDLLNLLGNKKMVLIDTTGLAPNDPRKRGMLDVLDLPGVNRLLVLNAGGHGDSLDDVVSSFKSTGAQQAVLSKTDEAAKLGPALDAIIRHQLVLRGVTMGQKVPEDWEAADAAKLVRQSMRSPAKSAFDPKPADLDFFFTPASASQAGRLDA